MLKLLLLPLSIHCFSSFYPLLKPLYPLFHCFTPIPNLLNPLYPPVVSSPLLADCIAALHPLLLDDFIVDQSIAAISHAKENSIFGFFDLKMLVSAGTRLKVWQQAAVAVGSAFGALLDPKRADLIAALGETTGKPAFQRALDLMKKNPEGRAILSERPRVLSSSVGHAWDLPEGTFGAAYAMFMGTRNFSPDDRPPVRFMETEELAYVAMRAREVHDFWHVLFGLPTNLIGESALKVIEFEQMLLPMCLLSVVGGTARFSAKQRALFFQHYFPWATRAGMQCTDLMSVYYERHFHENLDDVRRKWGIIPASNPKSTD